MTDVFALAAELVGVGSESHHETEIADLVEARLPRHRSRSHDQTRR